jgi:hypothetical protein
MKFVIKDKLDLDSVSKAVRETKKYPTGTIRVWNGQKFRKFNEGDWRPLPKKAKPKEEVDSKKREPSEKPLLLADKKKKIKLIAYKKSKKLGFDEKSSKISPQLLEKITRLCTGKDRQVELEGKELQEILQYGKFGILSIGSNPNSEKTKKEEIKKREKELEKDLIENCYAYTKIVGHRGGKTDTSLVMIHEANKENLKNLGEKYDQELVIYSEEGKNEFIFTSGEKKDKYYVGNGLSTEVSDEDFYFEVDLIGKKKANFSLNVDLEKLFKPIQKSLYFINPDLMKAGLPIGTIHEWGGQKYRKFGENDWRPVTQPKMPKNEEQPQPKAPKKQEKTQSPPKDQKFIADRIKKIEAVLSAKLEVSVNDNQNKQRGEAKKDGSSFAQGTEADKGRPSNNLGPPPPENRAFVKPGKDLSVEEVESFIEKFKPDYVEMQGLGSTLKSAGASHFGNRLKDRYSLHEKMQGRLGDRSLNTATDVIAARSLADSIDNQKSVLEHMKKNFELIEVEDSSSKARPDGYRAIHVLFKTKSGKISELQIKTHRQQIFSGFTHDTIYKPSKELAKEFGKGEDGKPKNKEVSQYLTSLSDYLHGLDNGEKDSLEKRPKEPKILLDNGIKFPWGEIDRLNKKDLSKFSQQEQSQNKKFKDFESKEKGKIKHFVVIRSPKKENLEIKEFDSFEDADGFVKKHSSNHQGQMPLGYSESKQEFLKVFSEYRPEGWEEEPKGIPPELKEKVKRLGKGQGREVSFTEEEAKILLESGKYALLSAGTNPADGKDKGLSKEQIEKRYKDLKNDLIDGGYAYSPCLGKYGNVEDSYLVMVHDVDRENIKELGAKYNQDSVVYADSGKNEMIFTTGANKGKLHRGEGLDPNAEKADDYYSEITLSNGKKLKFSLKFDFEKFFEDARKSLQFFVTDISKALGRIGFYIKG